MDDKQVIDQVRLFLTQIALELEEAAGGARNAAGCLHDRNAAWTQVHQLFARLGQADHLINRLKSEIDGAVKGAGKPPQRSPNGEGPAGQLR